MVYGRSSVHVQNALVRLSRAARRLGLTVNTEKTFAMRFRNGGRVPSAEILHLDGRPLGYVNMFVYLGLCVPYNAR